jgi:CRP/FNR family transcriptional regulator, cyclic AMP receptor protein
MTTTGPLIQFLPFDRLTAAQLAAVASTARQVRIDSGLAIFEEEQPAVGCWLIHTGQVELSTHVPGRGSVVVQTLGPGDLLGLSWLVPPYRWHFTATAVEPTTATKLDTDRLRRLAADDPSLGYPLVLALFEELLTRLQSARARLLQLYRSPRER